MKNRVRLVSLVMGVFIFLFLVTTVLAEDFSADMVNTTKDRIFRGKIFVTKDKTRMETPMSITITRMDRKVVWLLLPKNKMYMERPYDSSNVPPISGKIKGEIERKLLGQEKIDGRMTDKYQIVYKQDGKTETVFLWIAAGLQIPVKITAGDGNWTIEFKNIKTGKQPDALFEVPADYQKFSY